MCECCRSARRSPLLQRCLTNPFDDIDCPASVAAVAATLASCILVSSTSAAMDRPRRSISSTRSTPMYWVYPLFGVAEPLVNFMTAALITWNHAIFLQLIFPEVQVRSIEDPVMAALCRMYASVLICFGLCQAFILREWRENVRDPQALRRLRAWSWLMLVPDFHHMVYAYGQYLVGRSSSFDAACAAHYGIQGGLTLGRFYLLATVRTAGEKRT